MSEPVTFATISKAFSVIGVKMIAAVDQMAAAFRAFGRAVSKFRVRQPRPIRHVDVDALFPGHLVNNAADDAWPWSS